MIIQLLGPRVALGESSYRTEALLLCIQSPVVIHEMHASVCNLLEGVEHQNSDSRAKWLVECKKTNEALLLLLRMMVQLCY